MCYFDVQITSCVNRVEEHSTNHRFLKICFKKISYLYIEPQSYDIPARSPEHGKIREIR